MALNPSGAISLAGPVAGQSIALELGLSPTAQITLNDTAVRTLAGVASGAIIMPTNFWGKSNFTGTQRAIFGFGTVGVNPSTTRTAITNLVSNTGVVAADTPGVGTARTASSSASYGGDKAIFAYGLTPLVMSAKNLVSNTGVMSADAPGVGTARGAATGAKYGGDKAIFVFGTVPTDSPATRRKNMSNLVSNTGVVATDTSTVAQTRSGAAGAGYGGDKAIVSYGTGTTFTNLISNTGVVASDTPGVGTVRVPAAAGYGGDKAIFAYGAIVNVSNLISNTGVVAADTPGIGSARGTTAGAGYGGDKAIFAYGFAVPSNVRLSVSNLVSNTGVVSGDTPGVGTARNELSAAGYSST
jgi:hypothetical protein